MEKPKILVESGFASDENDALEKLRDFAMSLSSSKVTEVSSSPDLHVIQSINTLDEVDKVCNALSSRLREWYGLHFPELDNIIDGIAGYSKIVTTGRREDLNEDAFTNAGFPESKVNMLNVVQEKSRGGEISDENLEIVKSLAQRMLDMLDLRKNLEDHLEKEMNNVAPNLAIILGTGVAARMLSRTGSLKKLSSLPASTIQVLGAKGHCSFLFQSKPQIMISAVSQIKHASILWARDFTISRFSSDISPPRLFSCTTLSMFTLDSGNPALVNASSFRSSRLPVVTIFEYPAMPSIMLSSSGKCNPYHSRNRELSALHTLSTSSNVFIDCITCRSGLLETSVTFDDESDIAKSRSFSKASFSSDANPDSTSIFGFSICLFSQRLQLRYSLWRCLSVLQSSC